MTGDMGPASLKVAGPSWLRASGHRDMPSVPSWLLPASWGQGWGDGPTRSAPRVSALPNGVVEKMKVVWGVRGVGLQASTLLSMVPLAPQRAEMQPPVPSVVW